MVIVSHARAGRPYRVSSSPTFLPKLARFALPLMLNGLLLFAAGQGDRVLIGQRLGLAELGAYSATLLLIFYPATLIQRFLSTLSLPRIAREHADPMLQDQHIRDLLGMNTTLAIGMVVGFAVVGSLAARLLYGAKYEQPELTVTLIGVLQATRFMRGFPTVTALAMGRSRVVLAGTVGAMTGWPLALAGFLWIGGLNGLITGFVVGEGIALGLAVGLLGGQRLRASGLDLAQFAGACCLLTVWRLPFVWQTLPGVVALAVISLVTTTWVARAQAATVLSLARLVAERARWVVARWVAIWSPQRGTVP
jgi:O-antigen/teichoic acid export membrane protein